MNPRYRRLLIPGLLVALIVVVVIASLVDRADAAADEPAVVLGDSRITESSGLAVSSAREGLAYTVNDSGNAAEVFAVDLTSGDVVGVTTLRAELRDVEALALRDGTLWVGDVGDNRAERDDLALYAIDEPGRTTATVDPKRYPVALDGGPADVEALLAPPDSDLLHVVTKSLGGGTVMTLDADDPDPARTTEFAATASDLPALVTDGAFSPDGSQVALLSYGSLWVVDPADWTVAGSGSLPSLKQSETLAFVSDVEVLVGTEGADSPLYRLDVPAAGPAAGGIATVATSVPPRASATPAPVSSESDTGVAIDTSTVLLGGVGVAAVAVLLVLVARRRHSSEGSSRPLR